jgi:hypothetical protein
MKALLWLSGGFHMDRREVLVAILLLVNNRVISPFSLLISRLLNLDSFAIAVPFEVLELF